MKLSNTPASPPGLHPYILPIPVWNVLFGLGRTTGILVLQVVLSTVSYKGCVGWGREMEAMDLPSGKDPVRWRWFTRNHDRASGCTAALTPLVQKCNWPFPSFPTQNWTQTVKFHIILPILRDNRKQFASTEQQYGCLRTVLQQVFSFFFNLPSWFSFLSHVLLELSCLKKQTKS